MTRCDSYKIKCPLCGNKVRVILYDTINATLSPKKREELLQGKINVVECPSCKKIFKVGKTLLYHDMERNFMVWYYPFESIKHRKFFDEFSTDGYLNDDSALVEEEIPEYTKNVHYVFSMDEMIRYILFREKLAKVKKKTEKKESEDERKLGN
ncbi:MAG: CpXC domain-containing protein [Dehalococcoidales bacterium]